MQDTTKTETELVRPAGNFRWQEVDVLVIDDEHENEFESFDAIVEAIFELSDGMFSDIPKYADISKVELIETTDKSIISGRMHYDEFILVHYTWDAIVDDNDELIPQTAEIRWNRKTHYVGSLTK
jgi:hypothetical protein